MQYTEIFHGFKSDNFQMKNCDIFLIFAQTKDCGYNEAVLKCTHNIYLEQNIRKYFKPLQTPVLLYKSGVNGGVNYTDMIAL